MQVVLVHCCCPRQSATPWCSRTLRHSLNKFFLTACVCWSRYHLDSYQPNNSNFEKCYMLQKFGHITGKANRAEFMWLGRGACCHGLFRCCSRRQTVTVTMPRSHLARSRALVPP